jgi:hypothetical protein
MSNQIDTAFVKQFSSNVFHLSQQKGSRLQGAVRMESQNAEAAFYDRIGAVTAQLKASRHSDTTYSNTPHSRRKVTLKDYFYADLVDKEDKIRMLISPESEYVQAAVNALGRSKDDDIISAALGNAYSGVDGATPVALPSTQKVAAHDGTTTTGVNLNVRTLRAVKQVFDENDVDESEEKYFTITSFQLQSLLGQTEITSADYASVKALVMGQVDSFMGFKFIRTERLARSSTNITYTVTNGVTGAGTGTITAANSRRCFAWAKSALLLAMAKDINGKIDVLPTKHYSTQIYASLSFGATRLEEEKLVEVDCSE